MKKKLIRKLRKTKNSRLRSQKEIENNSFPFEKSFYLPDNTDQNKVAAKMDNGVLTLTLKKTKEICDDVKKISINPIF